MKRVIVLVGLACLIGLLAVVAIIGKEQTAAVNGAPLAFEVSTIKPGGSSDQPGMRVFGGSCHGIDSHFPAAAIVAPPPLGRCVFSSVTLSYLVSRAYEDDGVVRRVKGGPDWVSCTGPASQCSDQFDIVAKAEDPSTATAAQLRLMLQKFLADQFKFQFHTEPGEIQGFAMLVAKNGPKLKPADGEYSGVRGNGLMLTATNAPLSELARSLTPYAGGPVMDQTGLTEGFAFTLPIHDVSVFTSIQEELGLRLEAQKVKIEYIVIDHAEKPPLP